MIAELQRDVLLSASGGSTIAAAHQALHDGSRLYTILVAYTDFGGCGHMVAAIGGPNVRFAKVERTLDEACSAFEQSAALFTRATTQSDSQALLAATRLALRTSPLLTRASVELAAAQAASVRRRSLRSA